MPFIERQTIIDSLKFVYSVIGFDDSDGSASIFIEKIKSLYHEDKIIFCNGGDRTDKNIPEMDIQNIEFVFGVGGSEKKNSSSWILEQHKNPKTFRPWGYYVILFENIGTKVKELLINPGQSLRLQRHSNRSEYWHVSEGACELETTNGIHKLTKHDHYSIPIKNWHRLYNPYEKPCKIIEIQYGVSCSEEDIETL
jgi:mannose-6-phosphate isomerase-like protein (cupin superfamily)